MSTREKILLAIYHENRLGNSDVRYTVRHDGFRVDPQSFNQEIQTLQNEGLIRGAVLIRDRENSQPDQVILNRVAITVYGLHYVKSHLLAAAGTLA